jgi:uncharacterized membrane protein YccC
MRRSFPTSEVVAPLRELALGLRSELRGCTWRHPRNIRALRQVASVALAVLACHALGLADSWWAAISAFTVMQASWRPTLERAGLRILGTMAGALLGWMLGPLLLAHAWFFVLAVILVAWLGLYRALAFSHGYAWVLGLVTFVMVACEARAAGLGALFGFARERVIDVAVGSLACVVVAAVVDALGSRPPSPDAARQAPAFDAGLLRRNAAHLAMHAAFAIAVLALVSTMAELRHFAQAMVTTIAVLIVPLEGSTPDPRKRVAERMVQRVAGCLLALALAAAVLPWVQGRPVGAQLVLAAGVWCAAYLQEGAAAVRYMAVQFGVAFIMVFVQDRGWSAGDAPVLQRMGGILAGIAVLALAMGAMAAARCAWHAALTRVRPGG